MRFIGKVALIGIAFLASGSPAQASSEIKEKDGVQIVMNKGIGKWGDDLAQKVKFTETLSLGVEAGEDYEMFWGPVAVSVDSALNIYILDALRPPVSLGVNTVSECRILKFDMNGRFVWNKGRRGEGPGEFLGPIDVIISPSGQVIVVDGPSNQFFKLHYHDQNGDYEHTMRIDKPVRAVAFLPNGNLLVSESVWGQPGIAGCFYSPDGTFLKPFPDEYRYGPRLSPGVRAGGGAFSVQDPYVYLTIPDAYEIRQYDDNGAPLRKILRDVKMAPTGIKSTHGGNGVSCTLSDRCGPCYTYQSRFLLNFLYFYKGETEDGPCGEHLLDFFDSSGVFLGSYPDPKVSGLDLIDHEGNFYCHHREPFPRIVRYKMEIAGE